MLFKIRILQSEWHVEIQTNRFKASTPKQTNPFRMLWKTENKEMPLHPNRHWIEVRNTHLNLSDGHNGEVNYIVHGTAHWMTGQWNTIHSTESKSRILSGTISIVVEYTATVKWHSQSTLEMKGASQQRTMMSVGVWCVKLACIVRKFNPQWEKQYFAIARKPFFRVNLMMKNYYIWG